MFSVPVEITAHVLERLWVLACLGKSPEGERDFKNRAEELLALYSRFVRPCIDKQESQAQNQSSSVWSDPRMNQPKRAE